MCCMRGWDWGGIERYGYADDNGEWCGLIVGVPNAVVCIWGGEGILGSGCFCGVSKGWVVEGVGLIWGIDGGWMMVLC